MGGNGQRAHRFRAAGVVGQELLAETRRRATEYHPATNLGPA
jgi:hypothetical protein